QHAIPPPLGVWAHPNPNPMRRCWDGVGSTEEPKQLGPGLRRGDERWVGREWRPPTEGSRDHRDLFAGAGDAGVEPALAVVAEDEAFVEEVDVVPLGALGLVDREAVAEGE